MSFSKYLTKYWFLIIFVSIIYKLWLFSGLSIGIHAEEAFDDFLFIKHADSILSGHWLGEFSNLTLAKGPFYSIFIAFFNKLRTPLITAQQLLYSLSCFFTALFLGSLTNKYRKTVFVLSFLILLFNPYTFDGNLNLRINRPAIYQSLTLLTISCFLNASVFYLKNKSRIMCLLFFSLAGVFFSFASATREESIWLLFPILLMTGYLLHISFYKKQLAFVTKGIAFSFFSFLTCLLPILLLNRIHYGHFILTEYQHPDFIAAYGSLTRVKSDHFVAYVPVSKNVRTKIAAVSPTFAEINVFLEKDVGTGWATITKQQAPLTNNEFDIGGGWFMWALRDAVANAGYYKSLNDALFFYKKLASEVNTACDNKQLDCISKRNTLVPPWNSTYLSNTIKYAVDLIEQLFFYKKIDFYYSEVKQPKANYELFKKVTLEKPRIVDDSTIQFRTINHITQIYQKLLLPSFMLGGLGALCNLLAVQVWTVDEIAYPLYLVVVNIGLVLLIFRPQIQKAMQGKSL